MTVNLPGRIATVAYAAWKGSVSGRRGLGLALVAAVFPLLVLAIGLARRSDIDLLGASELLYSALFLPVLLLLVCLVLGVALLRGEIEEDTIVYPVTRSLPRPALVVGKFLGFLGAALIFLLPAALIGPALGVVLNSGPSPDLTGVLPTLVVTTTVAVIAYGAYFLLLGLLTRQALVIGLIYGFLWETFVPLLPGPLKEATLVYYLRSIGGNLTGSSVPDQVGLSVAIGVPLAFAVVAIVLTALVIDRSELRPAPGPA